MNNSNAENVLLCEVNEDELAFAKNKRELLRSQIKKLANEIKNSVDNEVGLNPELISLKVNRLKDKFVEFEQQYDIVVKMLIMLKLFKDNTTLEEKNLFDELFQSSMDLGVVYCKKAENGKSPNRVGDFENRIKLPPLSLPEFTGEMVEEYIGFRAQMMQQVGANPHLSSTEKYQYLYNTLKGQARNCCLGLPVAEGSFEKAWEILDSRYKNDKFLAKVYLDGLYGLKEVKNPDNISDLRDFVAGSSKFVFAFKNLSLTKEQMADLVLTNIIFCKLNKKISERIQSEWTK